MNTIESRRGFGTLVTFGLIFSLSGLNSLPADQTSTLPQFNRQPKSKNSSSKIQIAILLDTSGSMKGLVDQARIQIWNVVNSLADAEKSGEKSELEVAVYQYGSSRAPSTKGYIKRVLDFSDDLDEVSRALFALTVDGGVELCGEVVRQSCDDLSWDPTAGYRAMFIAGNESFDQGETSFASVLPRLDQKNIVINSIYCKWKDTKPGESSMWEYAAKLGSGSYSMIDHNRKMTNLQTPYDAQFRELNRRMNESFVWYGKDAKKHMKNQIAQDNNAKRMSNSAFAARMSAKIGHLYHHVHSDMVDAIQHGHLKMETMPERLMPESIRKMTPDQRMKFLQQKISERERVRRDMATVIANRDNWLRSNSQRDSEGIEETWGAAMLSAVGNQLAASGFEMQKTSN